MILQGEPPNPAKPSAQAAPFIRDARWRAIFCRTAAPQLEGIGDGAAPWPAMTWRARRRRWQHRKTLMVRFILVRLFRALITILAVVTFAFVVLRMSGDPAR